MRTHFHGSRVGDLEEAKRRLPIPALWRQMNLPGDPGGSCRSPFRPDRSASFSIYADGMRWKDHATGESGDAVDFLAKAQNLETGDALLRFLEMAGVKRGYGPPHIGHIVRHETGVHFSERPPVDGPVSVPIIAPVSTGTHDGPHIPVLPRMVERINGPYPLAHTAPVTAPFVLPLLKGGSAADHESLATGRNLGSEKGIRLGVERGLLGFCRMRDGDECAPAWLITDAKRINAQARRMDGNPWQCLPSKPKARTLRGSIASWPIGAADIASRVLILLCEGGPDFLAALTLIACHAVNVEAVTAITMPGASLAIHADALRIVAGKCVRIVPHLDKAGVSAALKWDAQLIAAGASVSWIDLRPYLPPGGKDLNDALTHNAAALAPLVNLPGNGKEAA